MTMFDPVGMQKDTMFSDNGDELKVLTRTCPYPHCGRVLSINTGINGLVYYCPNPKHRDVTEKVNQVFGVGVSEGKIITPKTSDFPRELQKFSWAAFVFGWIWGIARGVWLWGVIMFFVPVFICVAFLPLAIFLLPACWILYFWFGFNANRLDWEANNYLNAYEFRLSHRRWEVLMKFILAIHILGALALVVIGLKA